MKFGKVITIFLLAISPVTCINQDTSLKHHLKMLHKRYPIVEVNGWEIIKHEKDQNMISYSLSKKDMDSLTYMEFSKVLHDSIWNPGESFYTITAYRKIFKEGNYEHVINGIPDTNYHVMYPISNPDSLIFISGKYYYLVRYNKVNFNQKKYYWKHHDSLNKLKGNELPELPALPNSSDL